MRCGGGGGGSTPAGANQRFANLDAHCNSDLGRKNGNI